MPVSYQIIPEHVYPHQATYINDNTEVSRTYSTSSSDVTALLCVFASPKGRDNKVLTIDNGSQGFVNEFGIAPDSFLLFVTIFVRCCNNRCNHPERG